MSKNSNEINIEMTPMQSRVVPCTPVATPIPQSTPLGGSKRRRPPGTANKCAKKGKTTDAVAVSMAQARGAKRKPKVVSDWAMLLILPRNLHH